MEDYHVVVLKNKMLDVTLRRAVSCDKHLNHTRCSKYNTRKSMHYCNHFIVE